LGDPCGRLCGEGFDGHAALGYVGRGFDAVDEEFQTDVAVDFNPFVVRLGDSATLCRIEPRGDQARSRTREADQTDL